MICRNCGKEFEGQFCPHCGHDSSKPTKAEKASKRKESVDKVKEKLKPASDFVKKHKLLVIIVAAVLAVAIIVGTTLGVVLSNDFRVGKMNQIKIGMTKAEVEKKLGKPHEDEASTWTYYSKNYKKLIDEANELLKKLETLENEKELEKIIARMEELEKESETAVRDEIRIRYSDDKVYAVEMLKDFSEETKNAKKEVKKARLSQKEIKRFTTLPSPVYAIVEYKDGSYRNAPVVLKEQLNTETVGKQSVTWHDEWSDTEVTAEIKVVKNPEIYDGAKAENLMFSVYKNADGTFRMEIEGEGKIDSIPMFSKFSEEQLKNNLTSVIIGDGVTSIGSEAFSRCNAIESLTCPMIAISYIPKSKLKTVVLTSGDSIGDKAFSGCSSLESVEIPNSVTSIGSNAFEDTGIWNNTADNSVVYADKWAVGYKGEITNVILRADTVGISNQAFLFCGGLESVEIPNSVTSIGSYVFEGTGIWNNAADNGVVYADKWAVGYKGEKSTVTNITLRADTVGISNQAFNGCSSLTSIVIPDSVTSIGSEAFRRCSSLVSVVIPDSVKSIGEGAFSECRSLVSVVIPSSVTSIGSEAFQYCSSLVSVVIPSSVTSIGSQAFSNCISLVSVEIPSSVTSIGSQAFSYCRSLVSVVIPDSVTSIEFYYCRSLESIEYGGTKAEWKAIAKGSDWNYYTGNYTVTCTDGTLTKAQS